VARAPDGGGFLCRVRTGVFVLALLLLLTARPGARAQDAPPAPLVAGSAPASQPAPGGPEAAGGVPLEWIEEILENREVLESLEMLEAMELFEKEERFSSHRFD